MWQWLNERINVLRDALTLRRVLAISIVFAVATGVAAFSRQIAQWLSGGATTTLFGIPSWTWGMFVALSLLIWFLMEYAVHLARELKPQVRASFDALRAGITWAIERPNAQNTPQLVHPGCKATYLRFRVETLGKKAVRNCTAHLTNIWKFKEAESQEVELPHVIAMSSAFDVLPRVHQMIAFLRCNELDNVLLPTAPWPFHLENIFAEPATYRLKFAVEGDGVTETLTVDVHWTGTWNTISARQVEEAAPNES